MWLGVVLGSMSIALCRNPAYVASSDSTYLEVPKVL